MGYWSGKCFGCYVVATLSLITFMTIKEIKYENKKKKIKRKYEKVITTTNGVGINTITSTN